MSEEPPVFTQSLLPKIKDQILNHTLENGKPVAGFKNETCILRRSLWCSMWNASWEARGEAMVADDVLLDSKVRDNNDFCRRQGEKSMGFGKV